MTKIIGMPETDVLAYLATPYSRYPGGLVHAFWAAAELAGALLKAGVNVYSPIAHMHPIAMYSDLDPLDHSIWLPLDELMMRRCDVLIVAYLSGWDESTGIKREIEFFQTARKPILDLDPTSLKMVQRA